MRPKVKIHKLKNSAGRAKSLAVVLFKKITFKKLLLGSFGFLLLVFAAQVVSFYWPRTFAFSFAGNNCFVRPQLLPGLVPVQKSQSYTAAHSKSLAVGGLAIYSYKTCVTAVQPPQQHSSQTIGFKPFGLGVLKKNISVESGAFPSVENPIKPDKPISTIDPLVFKLNESDRVFAYELAANKRGQQCAAKSLELICEVRPLRLAQSASYTVELKRTFGGQPVQTVVRQPATTVKPVRVTESSIKANSAVFDKPKKVELKLSKAAVALDGARLEIVEGKKRTQIAVTASVKDNTAVISWSEDLPRRAAFELKIEQITAADDGHLNEPFVLPFSTSGGPKVQGVNIGSYKVWTSPNIVITFDSPVSAESAAKNVRLEAGGQTLSATVETSGNTVAIRPNSAFARCTPFTVRVLDGLQSTYGVTGGSAWSYNSRTICQIVFSLGTTVQGRGIVAYSFGSGPSKIVFVGGTHGDEKSSVYTLGSWVESLEASGNIPSNRTIVIIPKLNPDGFAAGTRTNANNVDLNRNFPANDWKKDVTVPGGALIKGGGGSKPLSEPESAALAGYVQAQRPRLVLTYHAAAGVVIPNDSGDSVVVAHKYAQNSNVGFAPNSQTGALFPYDTTGAFENWLYDKVGIPTLLIELWTLSGNEFPGHQNALRAMADL